MKELIHEILGTGLESVLQLAELLMLGWIARIQKKRNKPAEVFK